MMRVTRCLSWGVVHQPYSRKETLPHKPLWCMQRLNLGALLGSPEVLQHQAEHGRPRVDVGALAAALQQRYRELEQDSRRWETECTLSCIAPASV